MGQSASTPQTRMAASVEQALAEQRDPRTDPQVLAEQRRINMMNAAKAKIGNQIADARAVNEASKIVTGGTTELLGVVAASDRAALQVATELNAHLAEDIKESEEAINAFIGEQPALVETPAPVADSVVVTTTSQQRQQQLQRAQQQAQQYSLPAVPTTSPQEVQATSAVKTRAPEKWPDDVF